MKFPTFTAQISEKFKISKKFRKSIRKVHWKNKMQIWQQCSNNIAGSTKIFGPYSGKKFKKEFFLTKIWFTTKWSFVRSECGFDKPTRSFRKTRKLWGPNPKKFMKNFVLFEMLFPSKRPSVQVEVSTDNHAQIFFPPKIRSLWLKSKSHEKVKTFFAKNRFSSKYSSAHVDGSLTIFLDILLKKTKIFVAQIPKKWWKWKMFKKQIRMVLWRRKMHLDNNAEKTDPEVLKISALTPEVIKKYKLWQKFDSLQLIICTNRMRFWQTYQKFSKNSESLRLES